MARRSPNSNGGYDRRSFLAVGGTALICGVGGHKLTLSTPAEVAQADAAARRLPKPKSAKDPVDTLTFPTPEPQPGGQKREYWIQARPVKWNVAPNGRDEWMNYPIRGRTTFAALVYQQSPDGFAKPLAPPAMPGPTLEGEVGDTIVVHFRNADDRFEQPLTVHPHGVRYNPE